MPLVTMMLNSFRKVRLERSGGRQERRRRLPSRSRKSGMAQLANPARDKRRGKGTIKHLQGIAAQRQRVRVLNEAGRDATESIVLLQQCERAQEMFERDVNKLQRD